MKKSSIILNIIFLFAIGFTPACKKNNFDNHIGPAICPTDNFQITQQPAVSNATVNFNSQVQVLTAGFNEEIPWTVVIKGVTSKSFKKYSGYGNSINITWRGNPDTTVFFQVEQCNVEFQVACKDALVKTFNISNVGNFSSVGYVGFNGDGGAAGTLYGPPYGYPNLATSTTTTMESAIPSPQGGNYLLTHGVSSTPVWYFGGYDITLTAFAAQVKSDPTKVYFNCFVNAMGSTATVPVVVFKEGGVSRSKTLYIYGDGWKYVSFPLSDANVVNPKDVSIVSFTLNSYPVQATSGDVAVDFITFTNDSPFITVPK